MAEASIFGISIFLTGVILSSCGQNAKSPEKSSLQEMINEVNNPERMDVAVSWSYDPDQLPSQGSSAKDVWTGSWWPLAQGGTTSAMEKYDAAQKNGGAAAAWEQKTIQQSGGASWAGHCNGLAAAGIHELRPEHAVTFHGVNFSPQDIEGLLVEKWQGTEGIPLVGRRCRSEPSYDGRGRAIDSDCRDFNPGAFHVVLGNVLGLHHQAFIMDIEPREPVWNYPVISYQSAKTEINASEAIRLTQQSSTYSINPSANQFMKVQTRVRLATGTVKVYDYVLEGKDGDIIGGEWIGASLRDHPDFAWMVSNAKPANPVLDLAVIDAIAAAAH